MTTSAAFPQPQRAPSTRAATVIFTMAIAAAMSFASARRVHADPVKLHLLTRVVQGQQPRIKLMLQEPVERLAVELERGDGHKISLSFSNLRPGNTREVPLPNEPGRHHWSGKLRITQRGATHESRLDFEVVVAPALKVQLDKTKVDLAARKLELSLSRPPGKVQVRVFGATGPNALAEDEHDFSGHRAGETLTVGWPAPEGDVARIDLKVFDSDGFFTGVSLIPWSVHIPHEELNFTTDSAEITATETPKLEQSLKLITEALVRHRELGAIKLFIAGHTDTQGAAPYNLKLSLRRAQVIAAWFRSRGLRIPIAYEGFGEQALLVATPDNKDEPRNRRVDYILAIEEPRLKTTDFRASWKRVP